MASSGGIIDIAGVETKITFVLDETPREGGTVCVRFIHAETGVLMHTTFMTRTQYETLRTIGDECLAQKPVEALAHA